jgi:hypothetical protein
MFQQVTCVQIAESIIKLSIPRIAGTCFLEFWADYALGGAFLD